MKLYMVRGEDAETLGAEFSKARAIALLRGYGCAGTVEQITITLPPREVIRRLVGQLGGYATELKTVYENTPAPLDKTLDV